LTIVPTEEEPERPLQAFAEMAQWRRRGGQP
jgi:hypothetical protein